MERLLAGRPMLAPALALVPWVAREVVREQDLGNRRVVLVEVVEPNQLILRNAMPLVVKVGDHGAQPGSAALTEREDDKIGLAQHVQPLATAPTAVSPIGRAAQERG
jgi:hypothetical protein